MAEYTALAPLFTDIANAIRSKTGETGQITANTFPENISALQIGVDTSDATASSAQILNGYTAYAKGEKLSRSLIQNRETKIATNSGRPRFSFYLGNNIFNKYIAFAFYFNRTYYTSGDPVLGRFITKENSHGNLCYAQLSQNTASMEGKRSTFSLNVSYSASDKMVSAYINFSSTGYTNWYDCNGLLVYN